MNKYNISSIGIGYCGIVKNKVIVASPNLHLQNANLKYQLEEKLHLPVNIRNDAKCAGLAEKIYGSMKNYEDCFLLTIGTGIGGAYFYNGKLVEPKRSSAIEIGHMQIEKKGILCKCGKYGCFEQYASITALKREVKKALSISEDIEGIELKRIIEKDKGRLNEVLEKYILDLCIGISNIVSLLDPEIIVLGGSLAFYEDIFLDKLKNKLKCINANIPNIEMATFKNDAGIIGATL